MTAPTSRITDALTQSRASTVRYVESRLRAAAARLDDVVSDDDVQTAERTMDEAERLLESLTVDPWDPGLGPLRHAREILGSHLLAADACRSADVSPTITAQVLQRGAHHARWILSAWRSDNGDVNPV